MAHWMKTTFDYGNGHAGIEYMDDAGHAIRFHTSCAAGCMGGVVHTHVEQMVPVVEGGDPGHLEEQLDARFEVGTHDPTNPEPAVVTQPM